MFSISKPTLFLLISANLFSISASVFDCSLIPTAFWCLNPAIAHQCLIDDQCSHHQSAYRNHPIQITLLYEALCGGCQQFILDVLEPKIYQPLKDIVDIQLVPYGNSRMKKVGIENLF
jgi:interferon gamma-inducible protein 30